MSDFPYTEDQVQAFATATGRSAFDAMGDLFNLHDAGVQVSIPEPHTPEHDPQCKPVQQPAVGPPWCGPCSEVVRDYVPWSTHTLQEAQLVRDLARARDENRAERDAFRAALEKIARQTAYSLIYPTEPTALLREYKRIAREALEVGR